jgi:hypothetical protein
VAEDFALGELLGRSTKPRTSTSAVGLHELEELRSLSDTDAADMLYKLSAGLDRVSLVEVVRELSASRNRLLSTDGGPSKIAQLLAKRREIATEIDEPARPASVIRNFRRPALTTPSGCRAKSTRTNTIPECRSGSRSARDLAPPPRWARKLANSDNCHRSAADARGVNRLNARIIRRRSLCKRATAAVARGGWRRRFDCTNRWSGKARSPPPGATAVDRRFEHDSIADHEIA